MREIASHLVKRALTPPFRKLESEFHDIDQRILDSTVNGIQDDAVFEEINALLAPMDPGVNRTLLTEQATPPFATIDPQLTYTPFAFQDERFPALEGTSPLLKATPPPREPSPVLREPSTPVELPLPVTPLPGRVVSFREPTPLSSPRAKAIDLLYESVSQSHRSHSRRKPVCLKDCDDDEYVPDEVENDDDDDDDSGDYSPTKRTRRPYRSAQRKRFVKTNGVDKQHTRASRSSRASSSTVSTSEYSSPSTSVTSLPSTSSSGRDIHTRSIQVDHIDMHSISLQCKVCGLKSTTKSDARRHTISHTRVADVACHGRHWFCCGVPLRLAKQYHVRDTSNARIWAETGDELMVGGCGTSFSRKDAYTRHLRLTARARHGKKCKGAPDADWMIGNLFEKAKHSKSSQTTRS